jgi:hypothetical protein
MSLLDDIQQAVDNLEAARTMRGYWLLVPRENVAVMRTAVDERGWTGMVVTGSPYVPPNTGYLIKEQAW